LFCQYYSFFFHLCFLSGMFSLFVLPSLETIPCYKLFIRPVNRTRTVWHDRVGGQCGRASCRGWLSASLVRVSAKKLLNWSGRIRRSISQECDKVWHFNDQKACTFKIANLQSLADGPQSPIYLCWPSSMLIDRDTDMWFDMHANVTRKFQDHKEGPWASFQNKRKSSTTLTMRISR
jgi:hypothetical protein